MLHGWRRTGCSLVVAAALAAPLAAQEEIGIPRGARPAPVTLEALDGTAVDLGEYFGSRPVLLEFWATWCKNCEALHPAMQAAHARYRDDVDFFAVAVAVGQSKRGVASHLQKHPLGYATLWDGGGDAVRAFRVPATSYIAIVDRDGRVAYTGIGPDQDVAAALADVLTGEPEP